MGHVRDLVRVTFSAIVAMMKQVNHAVRRGRNKDGCSQKETEPAVEFALPEEIAVNALVHKVGEPMKNEARMYPARRIGQTGK